jgi:hypothetical protein
MVPRWKCHNDRCVIRKLAQYRQNLYDKTIHPQRTFNLDPPTNVRVKRNLYYQKCLHEAIVVSEAIQPSRLLLSLSYYNYRRIMERRKTNMAFSIVDTRVRSKHSDSSRDESKEDTIEGNGDVSEPTNLSNCESKIINNHNDETTTDATPTNGRINWIEQLIPLSYRPYAYLARLDKPIGTMLLVRTQKKADVVVPPCICVVSTYITMIDYIIFDWK